MILTIQLSIVIMAAFAVMLYAAVGLIQNRKLFKSAPKDIQAAVKDHRERFHHAHELGWKLVFLSVLSILGAFAYGAWDGIERHFSLLDFFVRFLTMLYLWMAFDIIFLDWLLLTKTHFFQYFYPETEGCEGYHQFGFNRNGQLIRIAVFPFAAALLAAFTMRIGGML